MIRFIWWNWWRHKQRFILLLVGILIISSGLTFLSTVTESNFGTVSKTLEKNWKASYDIVVRPPGSRSVTEEDKLFEPNFLSGISGGISVEQYEKIKKIADVDIAAPLAVMGYSLDTMVMDIVTVPDNGVYRVTTVTTSSSGIHEEVSEEKFYFTKGFVSDVAPSNGKYEAYGTTDFRNEIAFHEERLLVGIDPEQEARLVGLDEAVLTIENSRYFVENDIPMIYPGLSTVDSHTTIMDRTIPILINSQPFVDQTRSFRIEKLDLPFDSTEQAKKTMEIVKDNGGASYLNQISALNNNILERTFHTREAYETYIGSLTGINPYTGSPYIKGKAGVSPFHYLLLQPAPLLLEKAVSPFIEKWSSAFRAKPLMGEFRNQRSSQIYLNSFKSYTEIETKDINSPVNGYILKYKIVGIYDPDKLKLSKDPASETPLETYRAATAQLVLDPKGNPINPPKNVQATLNPLGLLTSPPTNLTTIDAATAILGDHAISAIRVKVAGITDLGIESQAKVERVAAEIEQQTGLITDVIMGSSPHPTLIEVPANGDTSALGWIEQMWMKVGVTTGVFQETQMGFSIIMLFILFVAVLYVQATQLMSLFMRRKEFAVLLSVGWRPLQLKRMIVQEAALLGVFASVVSGVIGMAMKESLGVSLSRIALFAVLALIVYVLGSLWPAWLSGRIKPYETMRTGEITKESRRWIRSSSMFTMALNHFLGKIGRYSLSVASIALPTALLVLLLFISLRLKGLLYTSWVGQYISIQIGPQHYIAIAITLIICILTTCEIVWQNVAERKVELFLLKSTGWRNNAIRRLVLLEGWICGLLSGVLGYGIGLLLIFYMYASVPWLDALYLLPICAVPMIIGLISAWIPAEFAVKGFPAGMTRKIYSSRRGTERWFFAIVTVLGLVVVGIGGKLAFDYIPELITASSKPYTPQTMIIQEHSPTIGELKDFEPQTVPNESKAVYDLSLEMHPSGNFDLKAVIHVTNQSREDWDRLVFYMIPNALTEENKSDLVEGSAAEVQIKQIQVDGQTSKFDLESDKLTIPLQAPLQTNSTVKVEVAYTFTMPEPGNRFSKIGDNYYLAQFYPMLANYYNGWNKQAYSEVMESHLTDFTDFHVSYRIPGEYLLVSSAEGESNDSSETGSFEVKRTKEMFIAIMKNRIVRKQMVGSTEIRVFGNQGDEAKIEASIEHAAKAFQYYEQTLGLYPRNQLDILVGPRSSMEYPGIVTVVNFDDPEVFKQTLEHEIAHQWFYGVVSNDPNTGGFLDEGFTEFTASLFRMDAENLDENTSFKKTKVLEANILSARKSSNLSLSEFGGGAGIYMYIYAQPTLKLWELFSKYEGIETAKAYLKAYYQMYAYKQVDTKEFIRFTKAYFLMEDDKFFDSWLK